MIWTRNIHVTQKFIRIPGIWGMSFHNYAHGHTQRCPPCISVRAFVGSPSPLVPQTILHLHNWNQMNNQVLNVQEKLAMVAFACQLMPSNAQWTCIARFPSSSHVQCQLCRSGTCHNRWSTWKMKIILFKPVSCTSRNKSKYRSYIVGNVRGDWCTDTFINKTYKYTTIGECQSLSNPLFI